MSNKIKTNTSIDDALGLGHRVGDLMIAQALGFRQFLLRRLDKVNLEWELVAWAYNRKTPAVLR